MMRFLCRWQNKFVQQHKKPHQALSYQFFKQQQVAWFEKLV
jgi:hypothetical protein